MAVAESFAKCVPNLRVLALTACRTNFDVVVRDASFVAVALWRPYVRDCESLDSVCARYSTPWSAAVVESSVLVIGPLIVPRAGPCYSCYRKRLKSHSSDRLREELLDRSYAADDTVGPEGFVPSSVAIATASLLLDLNQTTVAHGRLRRVDLLTCDLAESRVIRIHGCDRCSLPRTTGDRYVKHLLPALKAIQS